MEKVDSAMEQYMKLRCIQLESMKCANHERMNAFTARNLDGTNQQIRMGVQGFDKALVAASPARLQVGRSPGDGSHVAFSQRVACASAEARVWRAEGISLAMPLFVERAAMQHSTGMGPGERSEALGRGPASANRNRLAKLRD